MNNNNENLFVSLSPYYDNALLLYVIEMIGTVVFYMYMLLSFFILTIFFNYNDDGIYYRIIKTIIININSTQQQQ